MGLVGWRTCPVYVRLGLGACRFPARRWQGGNRRWSRNERELCRCFGDGGGGTTAASCTPQHGRGVACCGCEAGRRDGNSRYVKGNSRRWTHHALLRRSWNNPSTPRASISIVVLRVSNRGRAQIPFYKLSSGQKRIQKRLVRQEQCIVPGNEPRKKMILCLTSAQENKKKVSTAMWHVRLYQLRCGQLQNNFRGRSEKHSGNSPGNSPGNRPRGVPGENDRKSRQFFHILN